MKPHQLLLWAMWRRLFCALAVANIEWAGCIPGLFEARTRDGRRHQLAISNDLDDAVDLELWALKLVGHWL